MAARREGKPMIDFSLTKEQKMLVESARALWMNPPEREGETWKRKSF
jgi:hypothetical protein